MPNFDAGTYFLTTLAPIRPGGAPGPDGADVSHQQQVRLTLMTLPTARQSPATDRAGAQSPFARSLRTHLCRFAVIDDAIYNGRDPRDPILTSVFGPDPIVGEAPDSLNCAYLMFCAEIDAVTEDGAPLPAELTPEQQDAVRDGWARDMWAKAAPELTEIYRNCLGFDPAAGADGFARFLARCQVETTMPFHDYWIAPPALKALPAKGLLALVGLPAAAAALAALAWAAGAERVWLVSALTDRAPAQVLPWALLATVAAAALAYRFVMARGARPFPPPEGASLPGVLKALHLQQRFADFAIARQGDDPAALHAAFAAFLARERPEDLGGPTQPPGVIRTTPAEV